MIFPSTQVQWMDVTTEKVRIDSIMSMYQTYSYREYNYEENRVSEKISEILFEEETVKTTDGWGWTDVIAIRKIDMTACAFVQANGHQLRLCPETLIPIWDINNPVKGFHGEMKYPYEVMSIGYLFSKCLDDEHNPPENPIVKIRSQDSDPRDFAQLKSVTLKDSHRAYNHSYQIITKSGFYNANDIVLWGRENIPENYCEVCPVVNTLNCAGCRRVYEKLHTDPEV